MRTRLIFTFGLLLSLAVLAVAQQTYTGPKPPESAQPGDVWVNPTDGARLVYIPAGSFVMGSDSGDANAKPARTVTLGGYWMYIHEVTVAQYVRFTMATRRKMPDPPPWVLEPQQPMVNVTWADADAYARWAGVSLPTEAQWERAARGGDDRIYPWGAEWPPPARSGNLVDITLKAKHPGYPVIDGYSDGYAYTAPVGSFAPNPFGLFDLAGNVWEWCADWYRADYYGQAPSADPPGPGEAQATEVYVWQRRAATSGNTPSMSLVAVKVKPRVIRGGGWNHGQQQELRVFHRGFHDPSGTNMHYIGFRCVYTPPAAP